MKKGLARRKRERERRGKFPQGTLFQRDILTYTHTATTEAAACIVCVYARREERERREREGRERGSDNFAYTYARNPRIRVCCCCNVVAVVVAWRLLRLMPLSLFSLSSKFQEPIRLHACAVCVFRTHIGLHPPLKLQVYEILAVVIALCLLRYTTQISFSHKM